MLKVGTTVLKDFNLKNIYRPEYSKLHNAGYMHMHDLDFSSLTINSISSDSWVVLKDSSGQVSLLKGRELDRFFNEARSEMVGFNGWQTLSLDNKFVNLELARRKHKKCMIYVVRSPSAMIRVTGEHVVPVKRDGVIKEVEALDIKVGDELIGGKLPQLDSSIDELNLLDFLPQNVCHSIEDGHRLKLRESKLVSKFPSITLKLTRDLGRLSGIFYTYGAVNEDSRVFISSDMKDNLMDEFKEIVYKLSSSAKFIPVHELHDSFFEIDDEYVSYLLRDVLCYKRYAYDYHIPGWYFNTNDEFLKGFIDVINHTTLPYVDLFSKNREFVEDFRLLLKKFDIDAVVHHLPRIKNGEGEYVEDHSWYLTYKPCNLFGQETEKTKPDYVVQSITREDYDDYVYDLQTEDHHFWSNGVIIHNCLYIPLSKLLHRGYSTGHGFLRAPATIRSASALTCIAIQSSQNDFFGGQAIPSLDYSLAPYVAKSYVRNCVEYLKDSDLIPDTVDIKKNFIHYFDDEITKDIEKPVEQNYSIMDHLDEIDSKLNDLIDISPKQLAHMHKVAKRRTTGDTEQAMEAMVHNLCTMNCLAPDQEFWVYDTAVHQWVIYTAETFSRVFVPGRFYAFSLNNLTGDSEIKPITGAWATFNDKPMVKVTDKSGASFVTTFDHRYLTVTDDCSFDYVQAQNLKYTVHPRNFNLFSEVNYIAEDVSQHVRRNECTIRYKKDYVPYSLALAEFIGYYVGDGYITPDDSTMDFACAEKVYPEHLLDLCEEAFGFVPKYSIHARKNSLGQNSARDMVIFLGVKLNRMIRKLAGTGAANKHVPNFVLHGSWQMQDAFLHGYLMCDGSRKGRNYIEFSTISKPLTDDLRMMFASRGELLHTHLLPACEGQQALWTGILGGGAARRLHLQYLVNGANTSFEIPRYNTSHITSKLKEAKIPWGPLPRVPRRENGAIRYEELPQIEMDDALRDTLNPFTKCFKVDVVSIEQAPDCPVVYDIEVADNANFLTASGFIVHNSRAGSQTPFSSVNVGLSTTWEGRTVTHSLLKAVEAGLGLGETAIFPISIFKMKKGVTDKGSTNYDLFQYACKVSAKRLYPNFLSIDAPFNLIHYRKDRPEYQASAMGCVHGTETSLWKLDDEIYVSDFGRMSRILMNKYPLIQYSEISHYMDLEKADIRIWDSFNNKFAKVKKFIINQNVTDWVIVKLDDESTITITPDHPLPVEGRGRIRADELKRGDRIKHSINEKLYTGSDEFATVLSIEKASIGSISETTSYDVETETDRFDLDSIFSFNCRTRVLENKVDPQHAITEGRGNLFWTTINFPLIALDAKKEAGLTNPIPIFMNKLHEIVNSVIQYSLDRFKVVAKRKAKNYPFMMGQHEYVGSEKLLPNDDIESVIKEGTMAVGFIGLSETLVALIGKHHGESEEAQELGLTILNTMKKWVDEASEKYGYNFGVMASPAEGCTGRLLRITRKKYGVIKGITDKEYFTNSFHICPTYKISAWKKVQLEAPYHAICTSGAISYVELDTDTVRNPQAFEELVNFMAGSGCGYFAINHPMTRDPVCGYVGPLRPDGSCPRCGRKEFEGVAVNKLLSLTSYSPDPEYDVRLHENEETTTNTL